MTIRLMMIAALLVPFAAGCPDDDAPVSTPDAQDIVGNETTGGDTDGGTMNPDIDAATNPDSDATVNPDIDVNTLPKLTTGALAVTTFCAGTDIEIPFTLTLGSVNAYRVYAQLSDASGSFEDPTNLGSDLTTESGTITATLDGGLEAGAGYRVRVAILSPEVFAANSGQAIEILGAPAIEIAISPQRVLPGETVRFVDNTKGVASRTWSFPADASVAMSNETIVDVTFSEPGVKTVTLEAIAANGCSATETLDDEFGSVRVLSCTPSIPADAQIITEPTEETVGGASTGWLCGAGSWAGFGGVKTIFVEPGAFFEFRGGGSYTVFVKAGGTFKGGSGGIATIISEPGAIVTGHSGVEYRIDCPVLEFDYSDAPENGCIPTGIDPASVSVETGDLGAGPYCPGTPLVASLVVTGTLGSMNMMIPQLSNSEGDFANATSLKAVSATASGEIEFDLPAALDAGTGYRVRMVTSHPPTIGPPSLAFEVPEAAVAAIDFDQTKGLIGQTITFTNTSEAHLSRVWDFGPDATPATSTEMNGVVVFGSKGWKTLTLTTTDANGCTSVATVENDPDVYDDGFEVLSCDIAVGAEANVYGPGIGEPKGGEYWICGGAVTEVFGGGGVGIVEEHGSLDFRGGGQHTFYIRKGGIFAGSAGGLNTVVYETGAFATDTDSLLNVLECPVITVDTTNAPTPGCAPFTPPEPSISLGEPEVTAVCQGTGIQFPFSVEGVFKLDNKFRLQISDTAGSFDAAIEIGSESSSASGEVYGSFPAAKVPVGTGYRLRLTSDEPALVSAPAAAVLTVEATPDLETDSPYFATVGETFDFANTTEGTAAYMWSLKGSDETISTEPNPTFTMDVYGTVRYEVVATTGAGCADDATLLIKGIGCNPLIEPEAVVVSGDGGDDFGGLKRTWICDGGTYSAGAGDYNLYIEDGGTFNFTGGGVYAVYVKSGGTYNGKAGGLVAVVSEPGAILNLGGSETLVMACPTLDFDTTTAPPSGCE